jgi:2-oxoglutarate dehydrogenase E2 component (dihydrolipoamide succinyltransferase)
MTNVVLPESAEGVNQAAVSFWHHRVGDKVKEKEDLVEMATDKATFNLPSPVTGILKEIRFKEGESVKVGEVIAIIE